MALSAAQNSLPKTDETDESAAPVTDPSLTHDVDELMTTTRPKDARPLPIPDNPEPYIHTRGLKSPREWVEDDHILAGAKRWPGVAPGPWMPQLSDVRDLNRRNAEFFVRNGSEPQKELAAKMLHHNNEWWEEWQRGYHARLVDHLFEYRMAQEQRANNAQHEFRLFADVWQNYKDDEQQKRAKLLELTYRFDDKELRRVIETKGLTAAYESISDRRNHDLDQLKIINQRLQAEKREEETQKGEQLKRDLEQISNPNAQTPAVQDYINTGNPDPMALPKTPVPGDTPETPALRGAPLPTTTPATHADAAAARTHAASTGTTAADPGFPAGVTPANAGARRGELGDYANARGLPYPPPDTAGLNKWVETYGPASNPPPLPPVIATAQNSPAVRAAQFTRSTTPNPSPVAPQGGVTPEAQRVAPLIGMSPRQLDRAAWDLLFYNRFPPNLTGPQPKAIADDVTRKRQGIAQVANGEHGLASQIEDIYRSVKPPAPGLSPEQAVARADPMIDKITAMNQEIGTQLRAIVHGAMPMLPGGMGQTSRGPQYFRGLVMALDPTYTDQRQRAYRRTWDAFTGTGTYGQRITSLKTSTNHMTFALEMIDRIKNSDSMDYNTFINNVRTRFGDTAALDYTATMQFVSTEVAKSFRNTTTLKEIEDIKKFSNANMAPKQMRSAISVMARLMKGQMESLADTYSKGTMTKTSFEQLWNDPKYAQQFNRILELPFTGEVGLKDLAHYEVAGRAFATEDQTKMPPEMTLLNRFVREHPEHPDARAIEEKLRSLGWWEGQ